MFNCKDQWASAQSTHKAVNLFNIFTNKGNFTLDIAFKLFFRHLIL